MVRLRWSKKDKYSEAGPFIGLHNSYSIRVYVETNVVMLDTDEKVLTGIGRYESFGKAKAEAKKELVKRGVKFDAEIRPKRRKV